MAVSAGRDVEYPDTVWIIALPFGAASVMVPLRSPADRTRGAGYCESESLRGGWSVRGLDRQIASQANERLRRKGDGGDFEGGPPASGL